MTARLPWALLALTVVCVCTMVPLSLGNEELFDTIFYGVLALALGTTGAFVASRQPSNPIGWIFCAQGAIGGVLEMWGEGMAYHGIATSVVGEWIIGWSWVLDRHAYALVFLLFPTGRLLSLRWRRSCGCLSPGSCSRSRGRASPPTTRTTRCPSTASRSISCSPSEWCYCSLRRRRRWPRSSPATAARPASSACSSSSSSSPRA